MLKRRKTGKVFSCANYTKTYVKIKPRVDENVKIRRIGENLVNPRLARRRIHAGAPAAMTMLTCLA
jgi:hypothetical protein